MHFNDDYLNLTQISAEKEGFALNKAKYICKKKETPLLDHAMGSGSIKASLSINPLADKHPYKSSWHLCLLYKVTLEFFRSYAVLNGLYYVSA